MDFAALAELCAPETRVGTLRAIAAVESSLNPYAIGVVGGRLERQPRTLAEARATVQALAKAGYNFSVGILQINRNNFGRFGLTAERAFDPCVNIKTGSAILQDCLKRAGGSSDALGHALSCYYSGDFTAGYRLGYVAKVRAASESASAAAIPFAATANAQMHRRSKVRSRLPDPDTVFVTAARLPVKAVANAGDVPSTAKSRISALLF